MEENRKEMLEKAESKKTALQKIADNYRESKAKNIGIICLTIVILVMLFAFSKVTIRLSDNNYQNDKEWRELFSSYDYVSQDGEGYNYYNSDVGGDVTNGTENTETEEQE